MSAPLLLEYISRIDGEINLPGSKSVSNRALLLAALAEGTTKLTNLLQSDGTRTRREVANVARRCSHTAWISSALVACRVSSVADIRHMLGALKLLGVECTVDPSGKMCEVKGNGGVFRQGVYLCPCDGHLQSHRCSPSMLTSMRSPWSALWPARAGTVPRQCRHGDAAALRCSVPRKRQLRARWRASHGGAANRRSRRCPEAGECRLKVALSPNAVGCGSKTVIRVIYAVAVVRPSRAPCEMPSLFAGWRTDPILENRGVPAAQDLCCRGPQRRRGQDQRQRFEARAAQSPLDCPSVALV
jgi:hypothetical protein